MNKKLVMNDKVILIITKSNDTAINKICLWLNYYKIKYKRLNDEFLNFSFSNIVLNNENEEINIIYKNEKINLLSYSLIYFRRGFLKNLFYINNDDFDNVEIGEEIIDFLDRENDSIDKYILDSLRSRCINLPSKYNIDKLDGLKYAKLSGLNIPSSVVFNGVIELNSKKRYFSKPNSIGPNIISSYYGKKFILSANHLLIENQDNLKFSNTLIQEYIPKKMELRIFYFCGKIFSSAIYSQQSESTIYDSRKVNEKLIRYVPFNIDRDIKKKISRFMNYLELESGSIDMIITPQNEYFFLEVNPVGMFDYLGFWSGGISLERMVAVELKNKLK